MKAKRPHLSVVIPSYNEEDNIKNGALDDVYRFLKKQDYTWEVLIVDDASTDRSVSLSQKFTDQHKNFKVFKEVHRGKGGTVIIGMKKADGEILLFMDMDQATPIDQLDKLLPKLKNGYDIAIGQREGRHGAPLTRKMMAYGFVLLRKIFLGLPHKDTQCGFKAFKRSAATKIISKMVVFGDTAENPRASVTAGFDLEILYLARKFGYKVAEVKVDWNYKDTERVSAVHDSIEAFRDMLRIKLNALMGKYNL
jgi:dolichyl-phosphate beta-glucosyltransferase